MHKLDKKKLLGPVLLFLAALIWGTSFVAQEVGANGGVGSFTYQATRNALGALALLAVCVPMLRSDSYGISRSLFPWPSIG